MLGRTACYILALCGLALLVAACSDFKKSGAALQIRDRFCDGWPYGCTDSTRVVIEKIRKTTHGRQVEFRVVDRRDATASLMAAYFEPRDGEWSFLLFEDPFEDLFEVKVNLIEQDSRRLNEALRELKAAQKWFLSIYGRYAASLEELNSVSYRPPDLPVQLSTDEKGKSWKAEISSDFVRCELDISRQQLPKCAGLSAESAGTELGPLAEAFGAKR